MRWPAVAATSLVVLAVAVVAALVDASGVFDFSSKETILLSVVAILLLCVVVLLGLLFREREPGAHARGQQEELDAIDLFDDEEIPVVF